MLTERQAEIASLVAKGMSNKAIARETGLSENTVNMHLRLAAQRIPGSGSPRTKAAIWFFTLSEEAQEAA